MAAKDVHRLTVTLTPAEREELGEVAAEDLVPVNLVIRRAIQQYMERRKRAQARKSA